MTTTPWTAYDTIVSNHRRELLDAAPARDHHRRGAHAPRRTFRTSVHNLAKRLPQHA